MYSFNSLSLLSSSQEQELCAEAEEKVERLVTKKADLESHIQEMVERLDDEVENNANISAARRKLEAEVDNLKEEQDDLTAQLDNMEQEKAQKEKDCQSLEAELDKVTETLARTHKENKTLEERLAVSPNPNSPSLYELSFTRLEFESSYDFALLYVCTNPSILFDFCRKSLLVCKVKKTSLTDCPN